MRESGIDGVRWDREIRKPTLRSRGDEQGRVMKQTDAFIRAYHDFKKTVDLTKSGILPELDDLVWCMLMGVPKVPADEESSEEAQITAIEQRVAILKAVFVEANRNQSEDFIDRGLLIYDQAGKVARILLKEAD